METIGTNVPADPKELAQTGFVSRTGDNWSLIDFTKITDPKELSDAFWNESGQPQMRMAELAHDQPPEIIFRTQLANALGVRERDLYTIFRNEKNNPFKRKLNDMGIDGNKVKEIMQRSYQLPL